MTEVLSQKNISFPENAQMHAYSLINILDEIKEKFDEQLYFTRHPQYKYTHHEVFGSLIDPETYPKALRWIFASAYQKWNHDRLDVLTEQIRTDLENQEESPKVIFFYCQAGEDRTGQVFGSYVMRYLNWTYQQALDFDNHVETREIIK